MKRVLALVLVVLTISCEDSTDEASQDNEIITINVLEAFDKRDESIKLSNFIKNLSYVKLEYSNATLFKNIGGVDIWKDSSLIVQSFRRISVFDRYTGEYLRDIGHFGNDPNGYNSSLSTMSINKYRNSIYAIGWKNSYLEYGISTGEIRKKILKPRNEDDDFFDHTLISSFYPVDSMYYLGFVLNYNGIQDKKLVLFNEDGEILKSYPNHQSFVDTDKIVMNGYEGMFYEFNEQVHFKEQFNDTLFVLEKEDLRAKYYFHLGEKSPPYSEKENIILKKRYEYMFVKNFIETNKYLFFSVEYNNKQYEGLFNKVNSNTFITSSIDANADAQNLGFKNDLDGFATFHPISLDKNTLIGITTAEEVYNWFKLNPDKIGSLPNKIQEFKNIQPEENPIIIIGTLK